MKLKEFFIKLANIGIYVFKIVFSLVTILGFIFFFRWVGFRGLIAFLVGLGLASYLILSKNLMLHGVIAMTSSESFIDEITEKKNKNEKK